ncbi:hypothetical protein [Flavobacterium sp. GSP14]|uniref:hypothetical protein n=1 Tax=Flavobacterium sp. GSP14 TaxID=3401734 RepID=UPI003AABBA98
MVKNTLEEYKAAVKLKYEMVKIETHSSFLLNPSRAKLRKLCGELFKNNTNADDLKSFSAFFQFDYVLNCSNKLKDQTDKFRPIKTFFKGETDLTDIEAVNIAAILVDFNPRPFLKFFKQETLKKENIAISNIESIDKEDVSISSAIIKNNSISLEQSMKPSSLKKKDLNIFQKRVLIPGLIVVTMLCGFGYVFLPKKECMQWQKDHFEAVVCETKAIGMVNLYSTMPLNKSMLNFRKITICDTTTFFKYNKPIVWYCKTGDHLDFFNGPGFNPENEKPLKPITQYMIDEYLKKSR